MNHKLSRRSLGVSALALTIAGFVLSGLFQDRIHQRFQDEMLNHLEQLAASLELNDQGQPALRQPSTTGKNSSRLTTNMAGITQPPSGVGLRVRPCAAKSW